MNNNYKMVNYSEILGSKDVEVEIGNNLESFYLTVDGYGFQQILGTLLSYQGALDQWREIARNLHGELIITEPVDINRLEVELKCKYNTWDDYENELRGDHSSFNEDFR